MAGDYYYHDHHNSDSQQYYYQAPPLHLCCFLLVLLSFLTLSWYFSYEPALESLLDQVKMLLMLLPVVLLLALHCISTVDRRWLPLLSSSCPEQDSFHRAGGSPWGVAMVLVLLIFMVSYKSSFQDKWFPLISR